MEREKFEGLSVTDMDHNYGSTPKVSSQHANFDFITSPLESRRDQVPPESETYGYAEIRDFARSRIGLEAKSKQIYDLLVLKETKNQGKFKPSRAEEKWSEVDWELVWKNFHALRYVSPRVKEIGWCIRHDMLPGLKARAFKHRNVVDPRDKLCPVTVNGQTCNVEETLIHLYCECPGTQAVWLQLKDKILAYTDNVNSYPPVSDVEFLLMGFWCGSPAKKTKTAMWVVSSFLAKFYERKLAKKTFSFDELWKELKIDFQIAKKCKNGKKLDENIFS